MGMLNPLIEGKRIRVTDGKASAAAGVTVTAMRPGEKAIRESAAVVPRVPRVVFEVTGERPLAYLHDVVAQDVAELRPGGGAIAAVLTPNGRIAAEVRVLALEETVVLDAEPEAADGIAAYVAKHAPLAGCDVRAIDLVAAAVRGPATDAALAAAGLPVPGPDEACSQTSERVHVVRVVWGVPGVDLLGPEEDVARLVDRLDAPRATADELDAARIEAGRPRFGPDMNEDVLVNETPLLSRGVSMTKGCYPGQESVARVHNLGRIRRSLRGLSSELELNAGFEVFADDRNIGVITSTASVPSGGASAIALLRDDVAIGDTVKVADVDAVVFELP
jgi:tRNA-modifying protein YgfZ